MKPAIWSDVSILTLTVKPVKLRRSIYIRVPNDIADLIGVSPEANFTLKLVDAGEQYLLIYSVTKESATVKTDAMVLSQVAPLT